MRITKILLLLMTVIVLSGIASASMVSFDGKTIGIYNEKGKLCSTLRYSGVNCIDTNSDTLYIAKDNYVKIFNIKNPSYPCAINSFKPGFKYITSKENYLFGGNSKGLSIYDITNKYNPKLVKTITTKSPVNYISVVGSLVYIKMDNGKTITYRITTIVRK